ncbi:MAG: response regulator transcription factor [Actinomycetales bacterium]|nr:response regulator transcription factor [Candidatus Lutibacillus vidarii]
MARILVVDDDATVREVVTSYLVRAGYDVTEAADGELALAAAAAEPPDLLVLDLMLPRVEGMEVFRRLRARRGDLPVIMLTARGDESDRVLGLEVGADDYVTKPFSARELTLRIQSILRRVERDRTAAAADGPPGDAAIATPAAPVREEPLSDADLALDRQARRVVRGGAELALTVREYDLLAHFMSHPGVAFSREQLMREVWGWEYGDQSTVTVHVRRLREKVEPDPAAPVRIATVWGVGYRWDGMPPPPSPSPPPSTPTSPSMPPSPGPAEQPG